jgi:hypothetical protein
VIIGALLCLYLQRLLTPAVTPFVLGLIAGSLLVPTLAVILRGYTGLIYSIEILAGLGVLMLLTLQRSFRELLDKIVVLSPTEES